MTDGYDEMRYRKYRKLLNEYLDPPRAHQDQLELEEALASAEHDLAANPSHYIDTRGRKLVRAKGLVTADEVRANATPEGLATLNRLEMPKVARIRDEFKIIPVREWPDLIAERKAQQATNRPFVKFILDQDGVGSCASEGYSGGVMVCEAMQGSEVEKLNPWALYRLVNGGRDGGSSLSDNVAAGAKYGVPSQRLWPRSHGWRKEPSDEAKQDGLRHRHDEFWRVSDKQEFGTSLLLGFVVYCGYSGHAWFAVDALDTERIVWCNSWGKDWADGGFSTLKYSSVAWYYGCWAFRTARRPTPLEDSSR